MLVYTAPTTDPCKVKVSESNTLAPLVHDVNPALFTGADGDDRASGLSNGTARIVVVGGRTTEQGTGGSFYSRALQANTTHYYSVVCGTAVATGTFATLNVPIGNTFNELPQVDSVGIGVVPTFPQDRTTLIIDPKTGVPAKRVRLDGDGAGVDLFSGGRHSPCGTVKTGPDSGYFCSFNADNGGAALAYYIIPSTGEIRYLGTTWLGETADYPQGGGGVAMQGGVTLGAATKYVSVRSKDGPSSFLLKAVYSGDFAGVSQGGNAPFMVTNLGDLNALLHAFNPAFDPAKFGCGPSGSSGEYVLVTCMRGDQDSYGWVFAIRLSDVRPIAGFFYSGNPKTRWCGIHSPNMVPETPLAFYISHGLSSTSGNSVGLGPYVTILTADILSTGTTFTVAGEPLSTSDTVVEPYFMDAAIGDEFELRVGGTREMGKITGKTGRTWTVTRATRGTSAQNWVSGTPARMSCTSIPGIDGWPDMWWNFVADPTGAGSGFVAETFVPTGHDDPEAAGRSLGMDSIIHPFEVNVPRTYTLADPTFAGARGIGPGDATSDYSSYMAGDVPWFTNERGFWGDQCYGGGTLVSGETQLYKYAFAGCGGNWNGLSRKQIHTLAVTAGHLLIDISGPGSVITGADVYKYCVANVAGECMAGSSVGDIFANAPSLWSTECRNSTGPNPSTPSLCITNLMPSGGAYQLGFTRNTVGLPAGDTTDIGYGFTRKLTSGFGGIRDIGYRFKPLRDASWALITEGPNATPPLGTLMIKMPPMPTTLDPLDRSTFVRVPVPITPPTGQGIARAAVEFGYAEYGTAAQHYCTSRQEACLATAATVTDSNPFSFATTESSATASALSCTTSCTVMLPLLPLHIAYWQVKFYDGAGAFVALGARGVATESGAVQ